MMTKTKKHNEAERFPGLRALALTEDGDCDHKAVSVEYLRLKKMMGNLGDAPSFRVGRN